MKIIQLLLQFLLISSIFSACPNLVKKGMKGQGFTTRYWDCCKPSCAWSQNAGAGNEVKTCSANQQVISDKNAQSACDGGPAMTCLNQAPFTIDGCDMGFGFADTSGKTGHMCGRCFLLTFTDTKIAGKQMVVMAMNVGYDVAEGQFDLLIPGGGVGLFNGCKSIFGDNLGAQYGGLLTECGDGNAECLRNKCNSVFGKYQDAKNGCLFLANFMEAQSNPKMTYEEVECPDILKSRY